MRAEFLALLAATGTGFLSAVLPVVNAEAATLAAVAVADVRMALPLTIAIAAGQTAGKLVSYEAGRLGWAAAGRVRRTAPKHRAATRWSRWGAGLLARMKGRGRAGAVVLLSASLGLPPLLATSVAAGGVRMRRTDFIVCCFAGRAVRFGVIAWPVLAWTA